MRFFLLYIIWNFFSALEVRLEAVSFALLEMVLSEVEVKAPDDRDMPRDNEDTSILMMLHVNSCFPKQLSNDPTMLQQH